MAGALGSLRVALLAINLGRSLGIGVGDVAPQLLSNHVLIMVSTSKKRHITDPHVQNNVNYLHNSIVQ